jgi:hypothetical protein
MCTCLVLHALCCSYVPACRAQHLLDDAADAAADDFAAQRMQRLLAHCLAGWTAAVLVRGSARAAACQLLQRVWAGQLLADWRAAVQLERPAKAQLLAAWKEVAAEQRVSEQLWTERDSAISLGWWADSAAIAGIRLS